MQGLLAEGDAVAYRGGKGKAMGQSGAVLVEGCSPLFRATLNFTPLPRRLLSGATIMGPCSAAGPAGARETGAGNGTSLATRCDPNARWQWSTRGDAVH